MTNLILATDSYKLNHWQQYPEGTEGVYSYFEARDGAKFPYTVFFGLQYLLKNYMEGRVVYQSDLEEAWQIATAHFGRPHLLNDKGWQHVINDHDGYLPLRIKAVPEGTVVPNSNVLMTVENTCDQCYWLTNAMESLLTHVWYPSTVATLSHHTLAMIGRYLGATAESSDGLPFMLHDFGYRGASSHESAAIGGCAHLINSRGTDTLSAMTLARDFYGAKLDDLAFSVPATEHSVMTSLGEDGEFEIIDQLLDEYPTGILSVVADSYDIYNFVDAIGENVARHDRIMARDGVFVVRPDSVTQTDPVPETLMATLSERLWEYFGGTTNAKGKRVLDPHVRLLWGDGIDPDGIGRILGECSLHRFSAENYVFGMGGGLLQKVNRDTQRFAFKCSAQKRYGEWYDVHKTTPDKTSKGGRLKLIQSAEHSGDFVTVPRDQMDFPDDSGDLLQTVFEDGRLVNEMTFDQVRANAAQSSPSFASANRT